MIKLVLQIILTISTVTVTSMVAFAAPSYCDDANWASKSEPPGVCDENDPAMQEGRTPDRALTTGGSPEANCPDGKSCPDANRVNGRVGDNTAANAVANQNRGSGSKGGTGTGVQGVQEGR